MQVSHAGKIDMTGVSHVWQALSVCLGLQARRSYTESDVNKMCVMHSSFILLFVISLFNGVWNCCGVWFSFLFSFFFLSLSLPVCGARWKAESVQMTVQIVRYRKNRKVPAVWIRNVCLEYPHRSAMKCVKIGKKHLKHRCLADVSHNTSSSSDMGSCLSSIHMLMFNQAAQSGSISNHFLFLFSFFLQQSIYLGER